MQLLTDSIVGSRRARFFFGCSEETAGSFAADYRQQQITAWSMWTYKYTSHTHTHSERDRNQKSFRSSKLAPITN